VTASFERPVLITGAAGCIGSWVVAEMVRAGAEPVVVDIRDDRRRLRLLLDAPECERVTWHQADVSDVEALAAIAERHGVGAIVHLAALQIPFCKADPVGGSRVNVVGTVAVLEAARRCGIGSVVYASSVAAHGQADAPTTLYGVYKAACEGAARLYWQDWQVASLGLRPHTVYGPGRDQGLTSAPTKAMLAAAAGRPFTIPFSGPLQMQYAGEVAAVFLAAAASRPRGAEVFDLRGSITTVEEVRDVIASLSPGSRVTVEGDPLPFPAEFDDATLERAVGPWPRVELREGIERSISHFRRLLDERLLDPASALA